MEKCPIYPNLQICSFFEVHT